MKTYRIKLVVTNEKHYKDIDTLRHYEKHQFNVIENHYLNEKDKKLEWKFIKKSYPNLKKEIKVYKRSNPVSLMFDGVEIIKYKEELIFELKLTGE